LKVNRWRRDGLLLLQFRPGDVWNYVTGSVNEPDVCGLHQRIHENNFEVAFVLAARYVVAILRHDHLCRNGHFALRSRTLGGAGRSSRGNVLLLGWMLVLAEAGFKCLFPGRGWLRLVAIRTAGDPSSVQMAAADIVQSMDPDVPITELKTMDQVVAEARGGDQFAALLFGGFAGVALILAAVGIYGVMSFAVAQRTHEIGLRMALGASTQNVLRLILGEGVLLAVAGILAGLVGSYFVTKGMSSLVYGIGKIDFTAFSIVAALLMLSAVLASWVPAYRATRVDPMQALRNE
jgi:hypothetical protein